MTTVVTPEQIRELLGKHPGWFGVTFTKKDGSERRMTAQMGVRKHLKGGQAAYSFSDKGLIPVWDRNAVVKNPDGTIKDTGYRSVNTAAIKQLRARGRVWENREGQMVEVTQR